MVQALLFDLGNVIIDIDFERAFAIWAAHAGVPAAELAARYSFDEPYRRHERGEILAAEYYASLRRSLGIALTDAQFEQGWNAILVGEKREVTSLLAGLHQRIPTYMFSNSNATHQAHWNAHHALAVAPFRRVFVSSDIGMRKPEARAFLHVAKEIGAPPEEILFFDDIIDNIEGARAVGMQAVHVASARDVQAALETLPQWR
jgi:putative hydrolase of the HAD superfamily